MPVVARCHEEVSLHERIEKTRFIDPVREDEEH